MLADVVIGLSYGDEGKGKITHHLLKNGDYTHCIRFNGGCNAGHTMYYKNKKIVTHHIPAGVLSGVKSIIGNGCVVNIKQFFKEVKMLEEFGFQVKGRLFIAENAHIITDEHLEEDQKDTKIGTTKMGNGPAYRDKYNRQGILAKDSELKGTGWLIDLYQELYEDSFSPVILFEGAQGFGLAYDTYVGAKEFHGADYLVFDKIQEVGKEFGATTGRPRQCNWLNIKSLIKAINITGTTKLIINKVDILREVGKWGLLEGDIPVKFINEKQWSSYIENMIQDVDIVFSDSPERL
jgi:adenylosuccinate synthase